AARVELHHIIDPRSGRPGADAVADGQRRRRLLRRRQHRQHGRGRAGRPGGGVAVAPAATRPPRRQRRLGRLRRRLARREGAGGVSGLLAAGGNAKVLWYLTRGTGTVALLLLTAAVVLGVLSSTRWQTRRLPRFLVFELHRNVTLLALAF